MSNIYNNNMEITEEAPYFSFDGVSLDATPLCPQCLKSVDPKDYYCPHCGSDEAINPLTAYMPFVQIRYIYSVFGKMWRRLWGGEAGLFTSVLFILLIINCAPILLVVGTPIFGYRFLRDKKLQHPRFFNVLIIIAGIAVLLLSLVVAILLGLGYWN